MPSSLRWLHFSDLHQGMQEQSWMWPSVENALFNDLDQQHAHGSWDLVLFTGDLTQYGTLKHFQLLDDTLERLWAQLERLGSSPLLLAVPGNHDLERPSPRNPILKALRGWEQDNEIYQEIAKDEENEYRRLLKKSFEPFTEWYREWLIRHPGPPSLKCHWADRSLMPGDFSVHIEKEGLILGVAGLNTSFMQLTADDHKGRLLVFPQQLTTLNPNPHEWAQACHATLLLTHHPVDWLHPKAREAYNAHINPDGLFTLHLYGHMHEPYMMTVHEGGSENPRRWWQSPSLFGLEYWGDETSRQERRHGYSTVQLRVRDNKGELCIWPREGRKKQGGSWGLAPDHSYTLREDALVHSFPSKRALQLPPTSIAKTAYAESHLTPNKVKIEPRREEPQYPDEGTRQASKAYQGALDRLERLRTARATGSALELALKDVSNTKRALREGRELMAGEVLDERYLVLEKLGKGGYATVWKAQDIRSSAIVAVKVLHGHCSHDRSQRDRFAVGVREMARLQHPHIVRVLDSYRVDRGYSLPDGQVIGGYHYFVMEYLEGGDLHRAVQAGSLPANELWHKLDGILSALEYAHSQGVIHRDVKPANILLSADGGAKLTDFDLAQAAESSHGTRTGALGTVFYAAPEVHSSGVTLDERSDIYSLAMTAIFALRGRELTYEEFVNRKRVLGELRPRKIAAVLGKALAVNREQRYSSMREFREALQRVTAEGSHRAPESIRNASSGGHLADLLLSAQRTAPTYKPACMLAVLDALEAGEISLDRLEPNVIFRRFDKILGEATGRGWQPFFHLSTDGFWDFVKDGRKVVRDEFAKRRPVSKRSLLKKIDFAMAPESHKDWWADINERNVLRQVLIQMLSYHKPL